MVEENSNMLFGTGEKPPALRLVLLAIQHVCAMFGATILVPIVVIEAQYIWEVRSHSLLLWLQVMQSGVLEVYLQL